MYFSVLGFLTGWLNTRLYLGRAMQNADEVEGLKQEAKAAGAANDEAKLASVGQRLSELPS